MTPEELAYQQGFLYPLYLILIGGLITGGLIPYFNRLHGQKLKEIERNREEAQKRIDREREDYRFEMEIKDRLINKISEENSWCFEKFRQLIRCKDEKEKENINSAASNEHIKLNNEIESIIKLYFKNKSSILATRSIVADMISNGLLLSCTEPNSEFRKNTIKDFIKKFGIKLTEDQISNALKAEGKMFDPIYSISGTLNNLSELILKEKILLPHSE